MADAPQIIEPSYFPVLIGTASFLHRTPVADKMFLISVSTGNVVHAAEQIMYTATNRIYTPGVKDFPENINCQYVIKTGQLQV